jgi:hypothetical protein
MDPMKKKKLNRIMASEITSLRQTFGCTKWDKREKERERERENLVTEMLSMLAIPPKK